MKNNRKLNKIVTTEGGNHYYFSRSIPQVLLIHPILKYLMRLKEKGELKEWLNKKLHPDQPDGIEIEDGRLVSKNDILYYWRYLQFLDENKYFEGVEKIEFTPNRYTTAEAKNAMANTLQLVFEVTEACGLKCKYCGYGEFYSGFDKRENRDLDFDIARNLIDYITDMFESHLNRNYHKKIAISFYGGEPTLNMPLVKKIVNYVKQKKLKNKHFMFTMTSNGILLNKHMDYLAANDFLLSVSLDGNSTHNGYRIFADGSPSFKIVYNNIKKLKQKYPDYFKKSVHFISVIHDKNSDKEVRKFFIDEFNKIPFLIEVNSLGVMPQKRAEYEKLFKPLYSDLIPQDIIAEKNRKEKLNINPFKRTLFSFLRQYSGFVYRKYNSLISRKPTPWYVSNGTCSPFAKKIFVTTKGKILPCERILHHHSLGTIDKRGVHVDFKKIAKEHNQYFSKLRDKCNRCYNSDICSICLFSQEIDPGQAVCDYCVNSEKYEKNLFQQQSIMEENPQFYLDIMKRYQVN